jgi:SAM-dependent methyltransferase
MTLAHHYVKFCDAADFADPEIAQMIRELVPGANGLHRKHWELALGALFLEEVGAIREDAAILDVGAGQDRLLYWLANRVSRVVATDLYGDGHWAAREAAPSMLDDPARFAPFPYRESALEVHHMDARELGFPDATFDAVFSLSSIEHFGGPVGIRRAAAEIGRVLKPGGHAFIATECFVARHPLDSPIVQTLIRIGTLNRRARGATPRRRVEEVMTWKEIVRDVVRPSKLLLMQPLDRTLTDATFTNVMRVVSGGRVVSEMGVDFPHILVRLRSAPFTSVALVLEKP